jgi:hypothetical protein
MNNMSKEDRAKWIAIAEKHDLDVPLRDMGKNTEWWHIEPKGLKRGGLGVKGEEYKNIIENKSLATAIKQQPDIVPVTPKEIPETIAEQVQTPQEPPAKKIPGINTTQTTPTDHTNNNNVASPFDKELFNLLVSRVADIYGTAYG